MKNLFIILLTLILTVQVIGQTPEDNLRKAGLELPVLSAPVASYVDAVKVGNLLFLSGKGPRKQSGEYITGKVGETITEEQGYAAARQAGINLLAVLKAQLGNLDKVKKIVKVLAFVNCTESFTRQPQVINGFSDLMIMVFGEKGRHARSSIGANSLPFNMAVEIEMIVEIED